MADYLDPLRQERERRRLAVTVRMVRLHATPQEAVELHRLVVLVETGQMPARDARARLAGVQTAQQARIASR